MVGQNKATGELRRRIREVHKETTTANFLLYMIPNVHKFIKHNYIAWWQDRQSSLALESIPDDVIISHVDFAENYGFKPQNEVQSEYYHSFEVTIMVHITFRLNPMHMIDPSEPRILKEAHFWVSDDREHDTLFVQHCFQMHWGWLPDRGVAPKEHWVFSDGCASQFKSCRPMYFVTRYPGIADGCQMRWEYFGTGHGKGKWLIPSFH